ncbi:ribose 5-phosphate isomerase A [Fusarium oxysporum f. sp. raphani 54005]|uniref:Ribose-5-phosphate isomerase n=19 Tax=Fusarium oxysporum species complex TaxID=171631 RepID=X0DCJ3_FUSOX|nr:ribose 5-phosphate isomerase A [Fusarium oxysporum f. sp. lycopersici 4287]XP_031059246.1 ribose 5-phosphate isomerase A [Fusarium odoratissimum NRRL 54006]EWZ38220.1 ribose 5-phosphate isomerase A [Fusarium oxysporum Fo47]EWZ82786.1 ribose 5-phosphate isomerase A [Fusarium oxysporum f. sp. lycopersici MN25]EXA45810.1 ribose 5-phosphate isomerase A [Fusarium oxysporum f. sp. pisi HDV247]EXK40289.1 ribose 5-phosphate isomerase A [Fusarium oxysporum f. sp. melonis 26406]EXK92272.1 ribose 5-p
MKWLSHLSTRKSPALVGTASFLPTNSLMKHYIIPKPSILSSASTYHTFHSTTTLAPGARFFSTQLPYTSPRYLPTTPRHPHRGVLHIPPTHIRSYKQTQGLSLTYRSNPRAMSSAANLVESAKKLAAYQAVNDHLDASYKFVGIGSGSTVVYVVDAIVSKGPEFYKEMTFIPTGSQSKGLIRAAGLNLVNLDERPVVDGLPVPLDVAFDGADEVDEDLNLIKGGGACLFQEKLVAIAAKKFIAVADYRKQSPRLCTTWKTIPIEVLPLSAPDVLTRLRAMGSANPVVRSGLPSKAGECVTDNGMWLIDAPFSPLLLPKDIRSEGDGRGKDGAWEVNALAEELVRTPGIVEIGLFHGFNGSEAVKLGKQLQAQKPIAAYFGLANGEVQVQNAA